MRVPLSWLAEYVSLPSGDPVTTVADVLVRLGVQVDEIHRADLSSRAESYAARRTSLSGISS